jgi:hypothetical protein
MNEMQHGMNDKIKEEVGEIKLKIVDEIRATLQDELLIVFLICLYSLCNN